MIVDLNLIPHGFVGFISLLPSFCLFQIRFFIMTKPMNYDKWKKIEVSDDEDDIHPNIDTPSLFRWRHQARVERREQRMEDQQEHQKKRKE